MAVGDIQVKGKTVRPRFNYAGPQENGEVSAASCTAQMAESIRNICEAQLGAIERINLTLIRLYRTLNRIDRRLSQVREFKIQGGKQ